MIHNIGQVMLYVNNQDEAVTFWTEKLGFQIVSEENNGQMRWIEVAPSEGAETSIVLHDKKLIAQMSPELNLGTPSLMFYAANLDELYSSLTDKNVKVGEIVHLPTGRVFNFADSEDNYFAVSERK
ncbi:VOC family protein [Paenibacillus chibensis]|uniref:VOC family protein n=1 Tax=Paenibacillus chibensis TaxID=59846 RepID=UPI000FDA0C38|nr:VOC family protein [Paenibacillus chibensis]MEC0372238.1 VOC family protein [Paenibacillus chibensis]